MNLPLTTNTMMVRAGKRDVVALPGGGSWDIAFVDQSEAWRAQGYL
jgi:hypothetical protein